MLYGSQSRRDAGPGSDVDVLAVVERNPQSLHAGDLSVVCYTRNQLVAMVDARSLFGWHLRQEGTVLFDDCDSFQALANHLGPDPDQTLSLVRRFSVVLGASVAELRIHTPRVTQVAAYLLRSAIYAVSFKSGWNTFKLEAAAAHIESPELATYVRDKSGRAEVLSAIEDGLGSLCGPLPSNEFGSITALAVRMLSEDPPLGALAVQAIMTSEDELDYANLPVPAL